MKLPQPNFSVPISLLESVQSAGASLFAAVPHQNVQKKVSTTAVSRILYLFLQTGGNHLSVRPEPETRSAGERRLISYLVLLREEFTFAAGLSTPSGGLLPHHFTLTPGNLRRYNFCCTCLSAEYGPQHPSFQKDSLLPAVRTFLRRSLTETETAPCSARGCPRSLTPISHTI